MVIDVLPGKAIVPKTEIREKLAKIDQNEMRNDELLADKDADEGCLRLSGDRLLLCLGGGDVYPCRLLTKGMAAFLGLTTVETLVSGYGQPERKAKNPPRTADEQGGGKPEDTSSLKARIVALTIKIRNYEKRMQKHRKDKAHKRYLLMSIDQGKKMLKNLPNTNQLRCLREDMQGVGNRVHPHPTPRCTTEQPTAAS
ncbi:28S ribosomal protein S15, mitochondrial [Tupaia chinensis]|uniref:Small ribosomal subunit protein uS15m n=1 Tax=Tupaia chinensis TaxID=246437 RepID=L9KJ27_TUPCH|nr:28S ribosomal protein S15, mitochondrial [Tupaia chinensis]